MTGTRKARVLIAEQIRFINECCQSGMTDTNWCSENSITESNFYNWISRCRKVVANRIPATNYGSPPVPRPKQDMWFLLKLCRITFRNSILCYRCQTCTVTIHVRLKLLWRTSWFASVMIQFDWLIPGQQNFFDEAEMEQTPFLLEEETMTQELEFIPATCKVIEYYSQSYCCPSCKKGLGDTEKSVIVKFQMRRLWSGRATPRHPLLHGPSTVRRTMYDVIHRELLKCSFAMSDETRA